MCAFPKSTEEVSTAAVRSSTAARRRSATAFAGSALTFTISTTSSSAKRSSWRRIE
jgi:hypothetical protein